MVAISKELLAWTLTSGGVPVKLINLRLRKYFSALVKAQFKNDGNVICKSFYRSKQFQVGLLDFVPINTHTNVFVVQYELYCMTETCTT